MLLARCRTQSCHGPSTLCLAWVLSVFCSVEALLGLSARSWNLFTATLALCLAAESTDGYVSCSSLKALLGLLVACYNSIVWIFCWPLSTSTSGYAGLLADNLDLQCGCQCLLSLLHLAAFPVVPGSLIVLCALSARTGGAHWSEYYELEPCAKTAEDNILC